MAKVTYLEGRTEQFGYSFDHGEAVEVTNGKHLAKFRGNAFFQVNDQPQDDGLKAEHHGGGKFNITKGEDVLVKGLSKADADAFNSMTEDEKAAYVAGLDK